MATKGDAYIEVEDAFERAIRFGWDEPDLIGEMYLAKNWETHIEAHEEVLREEKGYSQEEIDEIKPKMFEVAEEVAEDEFNIPPEVLKFMSKYSN